MSVEGRQPAPDAGAPADGRIQLRIQSIEIFLYDWWPIVARRALYRRLAAAEIEAAEDVSAAHGPQT